MIDATGVTTMEQAVQGEGWSMRGGWTSLAVRPIRFAEWLFGPLAPGLDLGLMLLPAGWAILEVTRPQLFDSGAFVGLSWVSDPVWFSLHCLLTALHGIGLVRPYWRVLRIGAAFLSAWHWLFVALSLVRVEMTTGVIAYAIIGAWALVGGVYLAGLPRKAG